MQLEKGGPDSIESPSPLGQAGGNATDNHRQACHVVDWDVLEGMLASLLRVKFGNTVTLYRVYAPGNTSLVRFNSCPLSVRPLHQFSDLGLLRITEGRTSSRRCRESELRDVCAGELRP